MTEYEKKTVYTDNDDIKVYHKEEKSSAAGWIIGGLALLALGAAAIYLTDIDLTQTAELPEVEVEGGQMPAIDVDVADINVGEREVDFTVPTLDIEPPVEENETDDLADMPEIEVEGDLDVEVDDDFDPNYERNPN